MARNSPLALGKSTGEQTGNLLTLNRRMGYFQMRSLAKAFVAAAKSGDFSSHSESLGRAATARRCSRTCSPTPQSGIALFEKMKMPPLYLAFKTAEAERAGAAQQLAALVENLVMLGEMVEPVEVEKAGQKFAGHKISGAKISATHGRGSREHGGDNGSRQGGQAARRGRQKGPRRRQRNLGDYVVLFIGASADDLNFAADAEPVAGRHRTRSPSRDAYASKELAAVIYGQKAAMDTLISAAGGLSDMADGLRDGLAGADGLGDTRDLEALLRMVAEREAALRKLTGNESLGMVAFFEDGLKIESYGGTDNGMVDWKTPNKLASLGDSEDVVMFANMTADAAYDEKARAYLEALMETAYAMAMKVSEAPMEDEKMAQFKEMAKMFDTKFRPDMVAMWDAFSNDFGGSLGNESALVVDLKGTVPGDSRHPATGRGQGEGSRGFPWSLRSPTARNSRAHGTR